MFHKSSSPQGQELLADHCRRRALLNRDTHAVFLLTHSHYTRKHNISDIYHFKIVIATTHTQARMKLNSFIHKPVEQSCIDYPPCPSGRSLSDKQMAHTAKDHGYSKGPLDKGPALSSFTGLCHIFLALPQVKPALDCLSVTLISG